MTQRAMGNPAMTQEGGDNLMPRRSFPGVFFFILVILAQSYWWEGIMDPKRVNRKSQKNDTIIPNLYLSLMGSVQK